MDELKMIISKEVEVRWHYSNREYYESLLDEDGKRKYIYTKSKDAFTVSFQDLSEKSSSVITIKCDYCNEEENKIYRNWKIHYDKSPVKKDACVKCRGKKIKESNLITYGVENVMQLDKIKEKVENTNLKVYGVRNAGGSQQAQEKSRLTTLERYGKEHYFQTNEFKESYIETMQEKYGVNNSFQAEEVKEKSKKTMLENWGVEYNMQNPEIREKAVQTMYERSSTPTSKPQIYLHQVYGGKLNYPFERYNLDIAFPDEKIVIEYDGGGHDLKVTLGGISQEDFNKREIIRGTYLKLDGWKLITIKSKADGLPSEKILLKMFVDAKEIFSNGRSWVNYCIDSKTVEYKDTRKEYGFEKIVKYTDVVKRIV